MRLEHALTQKKGEEVDFIAVFFASCLTAIVFGIFLLLQYIVKFLKRIAEALEKNDD